MAAAKIHDRSGANPQYTLDGAYYGDCSFGPVVLTGLAPGTHTFTVAGQTSTGLGKAVSRTWRVDTGVPTASIAALPAVTLTPSVSATLRGTDALAGVQAWNVRYQSAASTGGFGGWRTIRGGARPAVPLAVGTTDAAQRISPGLLIEIPHPGRS